MAITSQEYMQEKERILNDESIGTQRKLIAFHSLLNDMAVKFSIPLVYGDEYKAKNHEIVTVFESIAADIERLQSV